MQGKATDNTAAQELKELLMASLPAILAREDIEKHLGGAVSRQTMAKADSEGNGPDGAFTLGRKVVYRTDKLVPWLIERYGVRFRNPQL